MTMLNSAQWKDHKQTNVHVAYYKYYFIAARVLVKAMHSLE